MTTKLDEFMESIGRRANAFRHINRRASTKELEREARNWRGFAENAKSKGKDPEVIADADNKAMAFELLVAERNRQ